MTGLRPRESPPLGVVAPFFVAAPLGLIGAGWMLMHSGDDSFLAVNTGTLVAATHAAVLGWLTLSIMGVIYQLGPAVLGGRLVSVRLAQAQFVLHVASVSVFVLAAADWHIQIMGTAAVGLVISFSLFLVNAFPAIRWFRGGPLARWYMSVALVFLVATGGVGVSFVGALEHGWFPITQGTLAGHVHLGLLGFIGLMVMGSSYQLLPMFQVAHSTHPKFGPVALPITLTAITLGAITLMTNPGPEVRVVIALAMILGPGLWAADIVNILRTRSRRTFEFQGQATMISLGFLGLAAVLGIMAAIGQPVAPGEPARLQLAYGVLAIGGWFGVTVIGNSFKVVPFIVWNARYLEKAGTQPVPLLAELVNEPWRNATLLLHVVGVLVVASAALAGSLLLLHVGGFVLLLAGLSDFSALLFIILRREVPVRRPVPGVFQR